ncbi:NADase-type glycan-binding domain-containing protein [Nocardioides zeae]
MVLAVLLVGVVLGGTLLLSDDDDGEPGPAPEAGDAGGSGGSGAGGSGDEAAPDAEEAAPDLDVPEPRPLTDLATASASRTAPAGTSLDGSRVEYGAENLVDGDTSTTWRVEGDGTGEVLTFAFDEEVAVTTVGLVNGYDKVDTAPDGGEVDWYARNRHVTQVRWTFDDGRVLEQDLADDRAMQTVTIPAARTSTVQLEIVAVSGHGGADRTPISEVELDGAPVAELG